MAPKLLWNGVPMRSFFGEPESVKIDDSTTLLKVFHLSNWVENLSKIVLDLVRKAIRKRLRFSIDFSSILEPLLGPPKNYFREKKIWRPRGGQQRFLGELWDESFSAIFRFHGVLHLWGPSRGRFGACLGPFLRRFEGPSAAKLDH